MKQTIEALEKEVANYEYHYRVLDNPIVSDQVFDFAKKKLEKLSAEYPQFVTSNSPLNKVGAVLVDGFKPYVHNKIMGSIENVYTTDELLEWANDIAKKLGRPLSEILFIDEDKFDGISGSIHFVKGEIKSAATRGDGKIGDDITENAKMIWNLQQIKDNYIGENYTGELRGEFVIFKSSFEKVCREENTEFKNPRNLVSGTMKSHDPRVVRNRYVQFMPFDLYDENGKNIELYNISEHATTIEEIINRTNALNESRAYKRADYLVDGRVIKVASLKDREALGYAGVCPNHSRAFKYEQEKALTKVLGITWQSGRRKITPVAELQPIDLEGSTISRATIHNVSQLKRLNVAIGDIVEIEKAGFIIPYINKVVKKGVLNWSVPMWCPSCNAEAHIEETTDAEILVCSNDNCIGKLLSTMKYFVNTLEIDCIGDSFIDEIVTKKMIKAPADLFKLSIDSIKSMSRMGKANATKIHNNIQKAIVQPLSKIIQCLGISEVGESNSEAIANKIKSFKEFIDITESTLRAIDGIGDKTIEKIMYFLSYNHDYLKEIESLFIVKKPDANSSDVFKGKKFVITGEATKSRDELEAMVKKNGGEISSSVSKKTDVAIIGSKEDSSYNSNKKSKAVELNIPIYDEFWIFEQIKFTPEVKCDIVVESKVIDLSDLF